ncbi:hypothetical protein RSOLAG1IB_08297 [Rhizoctonia solani AG-1 IB]|uniref:Uncharacterized protein n=1 Tax=Thanatephorus cucumeris (strain AG1-IB / isolate 7/3/14) TaxID=1108050 RepID=A0A0B7FJH1_THACB|nr:hypothetical protein RSOLAG1IB_08297 [Rhizoctonia solani AG-1 IB]
MASKVAKSIASKLAGPFDRVLRVALLLTSGYATASSQRRLEKQADWVRFRKVLMVKLQNIGVVSGLLLASGVNLLCMGPTRRMTYVACLSSVYMSLLSIVFGLMCLWSIVGVHPSRLKDLSKQTYLFYYLNSTPSLFGGMSALAFFVAVGAWVWFETDQGTTARVLVVLLSTALMGNAVACFVLGAVHW